MSKKYTVRHHQAVWETTTFTVDVPDGEDPVEYIQEDFDRHLSHAVDTEGASVEIGDSVISMDTDCSITDDETGEEIYNA